MTETISSLVHLALDAYGPQTSADVLRRVADARADLSGDEAADLCLARVRLALSEACHAGTVVAESPVRHGPTVYALARSGGDRG